jgi:iron complex transport system permease protein
VSRSADAVVRCGPVAIRWSPRVAIVNLSLVLLCTGALLWSLATGDLRLGVDQVVAALTGGEDGVVRTVVVTWRLPRAAAAAIFGAGLAVAGAIFQSVTRNPLAVPDVIGLSSGAYTGALIVIIGILLTRRGGGRGLRLVVVGVGVSAMLTAANTWMLLRAQLEVAIAAAVWGAGSLNGIAWDRVAPAALATLALLVVAVRFQPALRIMEMGDESARSLGLRVERDRLILLLTGVVLTAAVVAAAGPIAFVALAAPRIARRLTLGPGVAMTASALVGALVLTVSDHAAQHLLPQVLPVGVVTVVVGGAYLVWLLIRERRRRPA